jgi:hypothetical protein
MEKHALLLTFLSLASFLLNDVMANVPPVPACKFELYTTRMNPTDIIPAAFFSTENPSATPTSNGYITLDTPPDSDVDYDYYSEGYGSDLRRLNGTPVFYFNYSSAPFAAAPDQGRG